MLSCALLTYIFSTDVKQEDNIVPPEKKPEAKVEEPKQREVLVTGGKL